MKTVIKNWGNELARDWANRLSNRINRLSSANKKIGLALFTVLFGGISISVIVETLTYSGHPANPVSFIRTLPHRHIGKNPEHQVPNSTISVETFRRIESLKANDSLLRARPHLLDTIHFIEGAYQNQSKK